LGRESRFQAATLDTYSHVIPALEREAADQMERVLGG
jgi:hypothetical protein